MKKLTGPELIEELKKLDITPYYADDNLNQLLDIIGNEYIDLINSTNTDIEEFLNNNNLNFEYKYQEYNNNSSNECEQILYFPYHDVYLKASGYYSSYEGNDWDDSEWKVVLPTEKTITVFLSDND